MTPRVFISQFSPQRTDPEALEQILVQRQELLAESVARIRESVLTGNKHHLLFVGPRGAGKSHLITLIHHRLRNDPALVQRLRFAWLLEDETSTSFLKLLIRIYRDLSSRYPEEFPVADLNQIYGKDADTARHLLGDALLEHLGECTVVVIIENLDALFQHMDEGEQRSWRAFMQDHQVCSTIATAQSLFPGVSDRNEPFFGFFDTQRLEPLTVEEATKLLENIARLNGQPDLLEFLGTPRGKARLRAIHHLSGGNPRLYIILSDFLTRDSLDSIVRPFEETVDRQLTAYYQERLRWLSPQQREIIQFLCLRAHPVPVTEIAQGIFAAHNVTTNQLKQLRDKGYVRGRARGREVLYELSEPLMRLSFQVKQTNNRQPLALIVDFLRVWYDRDELVRRLADLHPAAVERKYFEEALARLLSEPNLRHTLLRFDTEGVDLERCGAEHAEHLQCLAEDTDAVDDWMRLAHARFFREEYDEAIAVCSQILKKSPLRENQEFVARSFLAIAFRMLNKYTESIEELTDIIEKRNTPRTLKSWVLYLRATTKYEQAGDSAAGLADLYECIDLQSDAAPGALFLAHKALGLHLAQQQKHSEAIEELSRALEFRDATSANLANVLNLRGLSFAALQRRTEQIADHTRVINLPDVPTDELLFAHKFRCYAFVAESRIEEAKADLTQILTIPGIATENQAEMLNLVGWELGQGGHLAQAMECYERVLALKVTDLIVPAMSRFNRGWTLVKLQRFDEALDDLTGFFCLDDHAVVRQLLVDYPVLVADTLVRAVFGLVMTDPKRMQRRLAALMEFIVRHDFLLYVGEALVRHLPNLGSPLLGPAAMDAWFTAWCETGHNHPQMEIPLRLLRTGIDYLRTHDGGTLLGLVSEERRVLLDALRLPAETSP